MRREQRLQNILQQQFTPAYLEIKNESHKHSVPPESETHFHLILVSDAFEGLRSVARHQAIYFAVNEELESGLHALSLHAFTEREWRERSLEVPASPNCLGGGKA